MRLADRIAVVSTEDAVRASVSYDQLRSGDGALYWLETRPEAGGVATVTCWRPGEGVRDLSPEGFDVTSGVHAYGGGAFAVTDGTLWCVGGDGLYRSRLHDDELELVSLGSFGDLTIGDGELLAVRESEHGDDLIAVSLTGAPQMRTLAVSRGFLGAPRPGPGSLAWTAWSERDMPWDACEVWVAFYSPYGHPERPVRIAGGSDESAVEPR
ncbi:hypothetical protein ACX27O_02180 [Micromonospora sp. SD19]